MMSSEEGRSVHRQLQDDVDSQRRCPVSVDLDEVFTHAGEL
jgi:hypothetical protein